LISGVGFVFGCLFFNCLVKVGSMAQLAQLNSDMAEAGTVEFDETALAPKVTKQLVHDACVMYHANRRVGTVRTKSRAEVRGTTAKLFRQKGTGRARQGSRVQPVRRGGGHAFAKRPKDWSYRLPRKALKAATRMALRMKIEAGEVRVLEGFNLPEPKTRHVAAALQAAGLAGQSCLIVTEEINRELVRAARNIPRILVLPRSDLNADIVLRHRQVLLFKDAVEGLLG
jgi:large subunit ribosomal protein L4